MASVILDAIITRVLARRTRPIRLSTTNYRLFPSLRGNIAPSVTKGFISEFTRKHNPRRGFTLIELLVVVSIIALLVSISAAAFNNYSRTQRLAQSVKDLELAVTSAQNRALSSVDGLNWGVHLVRNQGSFEIFSSSSLSYDTATQKLPREFATGVVTSDLTVQSADRVNVIFSVLSGSVAFVSDDGTCLGGSTDSSCFELGKPCLAIGLNLQGSLNKRYLKVNERNIFESDALAPCP